MERAKRGGNQREGQESNTPTARDHKAKGQRMSVSERVVRERVRDTMTGREPHAYLFVQRKKRKSAGIVETLGKGKKNACSGFLGPCAVYLTANPIT